MAISRLTALALLTLVVAGGARAGTIPDPVFEAVHGRVVGWAKTGPDWFAVYVDRKGGGFCGLEGAAWRMALVETAELPMRVTADRRIGGAMCGNELAWVRAGRFSDGRHREVAFMLWTTPAIGAWTYVYRVVSGRFTLLARFGGDRVTLARGVATVGFENRGRSPHGEIEDVYRFAGSRYRLAQPRRLRIPARARCPAACCPRLNDPRNSLGLARARD
jgi:hypothetical protein